MWFGFSEDWWTKRNRKRANYDVWDILSASASKDMPVSGDSSSCSFWWTLSTPMCFYQCCLMSYCHPWHLIHMYKNLFRLCGQCLKAPTHPSCPLIQGRIETRLSVQSRAAVFSVCNLYNKHITCTWKKEITLCIILCTV